MKKKLYITAIVAMGLLSCGSESDKAVQDDKLVPTIVEEVKSQTPHELELNDGEKWVADEGMNEAALTIEALLTAHTSTAVVDYQTLGDNIGVETKKIIRSCTMTGKGHDELHKWLLPFLDLKKALIMTSSPEEGAALVADITEELSIYNTYFK